MQPRTKYWFLENFDALKALSEKEKKELGDLSLMLPLPKDEVLYMAGDQSDFIYFLKEGKVKISAISELGKELILSILGPYEIFGELAVAGQGKRDEMAVALEDCMVCEIHKSDLEKYMRQNAQFSMEITKPIGLRMTAVKNMYESLYFKSAEERIRQFVRGLAKEHGRLLADHHQVVVEAGLTHEEIAKLTATNRQKVTAVLSDLEKRDIIRYSRKDILIKHPEAL